MTESEDSHSNTRPISVAELLAKNGTIGAPPIGGRRRRRRGNTDAVTVAELTGEIPIVSDEDLEEASDTGAADVEADPHVETGPLRSGNGVIDHLPPDTDVVDEEAVDYAAHIEQRDADPAPVDFELHRPRGHYTHAQRRYQGQASRGAEQMSPDPVVEDEDVEDPVDLGEPADPEIAQRTRSAADTDETSEQPSYLRSSAGPLFSGQTVADDLARRGAGPHPDDIDLEDETEDAAQPAGGMSAFLRGAWTVGQCIFAVAFGAGLFIAFDQLWKWNNIVALVLSVLVILGLVVGVRVVRKTEDIGSTLIAVAVGALVTLGPLALLQSN
jgi:hypothetical protein